MFSLNKVSLIGRVGNDPELKQTKNGHDYVSISIATTEGIKNKETGGWTNNTSWHRIKMYEPYASVAIRNIMKGATIYLEGTLKYNEYEKDGIKKKDTEIVCNKVVLMDNKPKAKEIQPKVYQAPWADDHLQQKQRPVEGLVQIDKSLNPLRNTEFLNDEIPF